MIDTTQHHLSSCFRSEDPDEECECHGIYDEVADLRERLVSAQKEVDQLKASAVLGTANALREIDKLADKLATAEKALAEERARAVRAEAECLRNIEYIHRTNAALDAERAAHEETKAKHFEELVRVNAEAVEEGERRAKAEAAHAQTLAKLEAAKANIQLTEDALVIESLELERTETRLQTARRDALEKAARYVEDLGNKGMADGIRNLSALAGGKPR